MKNKVYTYAILIIAAVLLGILLVSRNRSPFGKKNTSFASYPEREITGVEFVQDEKRLTLEKAEDEWLVNGSVPARNSSINFILRILTEMKIKSPVSDRITDSIISSVEPVRVRVYEEGNRINSFMVYKTRTNPYGNIMKMSGKAKPFIVYVPGHDNDIGSAFTLNELYWQPYTIFNLLPSEIKRVDFENGNDPSGSFSVVRKQDEFSLFAGEKELSGWDSALVKRYLSYYTFIPFETWAFALDKQEKQRIITEKPAYTIIVTTVKGDVISLNLWERKNEDGTNDSDRLYGKTGASDEIFIVRYFDVDPVLKRNDYFFGEE